jgi:hypothetical protein
MSFTARRISVSDSAYANDGRRVLRREALAQLHDAEAIVERARGAAFSIVRRARKAARHLAVRATAERHASKAQADFEFVTRAAALEAAYRQAQRSLTEQLEQTLDRVLAAALAHAGATIPAEQRLRIVCEQLSKAAGPTRGAQLGLCAADEAIYRCAGFSAPWPTKIDDTLEPGRCRLAAEHGEWVLDFDALLAALAPAPAARAAGDKRLLERNQATMAP